MVFANKHTKTVVDKLQKFSGTSFLKEANDDFYIDNIDVVEDIAVFTGLTNYVVNDLVENNASITEEELHIYSVIENILDKCSQYPDDSDERKLDSAACTCFLENLLNRASAGRIEYSRFIPYLGEKSKEYCRAWDEFTGVKSPGLWD